MEIPMKVSSATYTNMDNTVDDYEVDSAEQDSPGAEYTPDWSKWFGYYKVIPELNSVIDKKAIWTVGKGYKMKDGSKTSDLDKIRGFGKDTFNTILTNAVKTYTICGDFFAEKVITKRGLLRNLKPINSGSMKIISNSSGIVTGYEQMTTLGTTITFTPDEIFHLAWNRLGDEPHGTSTIEKVEQIVLMRNEAMTDMRTVFHRYVKPVLITEADTDDATEIAALKLKLDTAVKQGENMIIPKGAVSITATSIPQYSTLDPLPWIQLLNKYFIMAEGVPEVILGAGQDTTEATSKILYLAFQQMVEWNQLFLEEQIKAQLGYELEFDFPASILEPMKEQESKSRNIDNMQMKPEQT